MKWHKSTRLALYAAVEMAAAGGELVTAGEVAARYGVSTHHLAKVLQQLARAGIAQAVHGVRGGYRLARSAKEITLLDVVEVVSGHRDVERCGLSDDDPAACAGSAACRLRGIFDEIEQQAVFTLKSVRLSTLVGRGGARDASHVTSVT